MIRNWYHSKLHEGIKAFISHEKESFEYIQNAVKLHQPELIIELGSAWYGVTLLLHEASPDTPLYAFDIREYKEYMKGARGSFDIPFMLNLCETAFKRNVIFSVADVLSGEGNRIVIELLNRGKRTFLYCDNGKKRREVELYAKYLRAGDILGVHDWGREIDLEMPEVAKALERFAPHEFNIELKEKGATTRMFVCRGDD
jgi:hypothetical protein